ncbi:MAG: Crp/Fnr family transcriptional regulator [Janthinobacterium lividum]
MVETIQRTLKNQILQAMDPADFARLVPVFEPVTLKLRDSLVEPQRRLSHAYFPEDALVSVVATTRDGHQTEVGIIGRDGFVDVAMIHGADSSPLESFVQIAGTANRVPLADLRTALEASPALRTLLSRYAQCFLVQVSHTALANATHTIEQRLARWLVMSQDRIDGPEVSMTHEFLSIMLGVRRAGVTIAVQEIERRGLIKARRGILRITDRGALEDLAGDSYGTPEAEYHRLLGFDFRTGAGSAATIAA